MAAAAASVSAASAGNSETASKSGQRLLRSLSVLVKMAANPECLHVILPLLSEHVGVFVRALQDTNHSQCHSMMATFLHNLLKV